MTGAPSWRVLTGDVREVLPSLEAASFDAILSDPPYGLEFMSAAWDRGVPPAPVWREVLRLVRPGAMLLAAGGTRTYHRLACAVEDGGFEVRDCVGYAWCYGTGFPKSLDVSKALDKAAGATREVVGRYASPEGTTGFRSQNSRGAYGTYDGLDDGEPRPITAPATPEAATWQGYGTALAPAWEPYVLAMRPTDGTFAANARKHGVAGLNVDGSRIGTSKHTSGYRTSEKAEFNPSSYGMRGHTEVDPNAGRWPKNLVLDDGAGALLDSQTGERPTHGGKAPLRDRGKRAGRLGAFAGGERSAVAPEGGGPSRFFYCAKASTGERNAGLPEGMVNDHPTLKPIALCRYIATMLLPPPTGRPRRILVPFSGAGSEMIGALLAGWDEVVGVELSPRFAEIAGCRIAHWAPRPAPEKAQDKAPAARQLEIPWGGE